MDLCWAQGGKKEGREAGEPGEYWRCTLIEAETRLRVGRGIGQDETEAAVNLWQQVKGRQAHCQTPPPLLSDGWGGHRQALLEVYGQVPVYSGRGRPPSRKQPGSDWHYTQMVKQRDATGHFIGVEIRVIYGDETTLTQTGERTAYVERTNLTARQMNARLTRKTLGFSKHLSMLQAASVWEDMVYNLVRPLKTLRLEVNDGQRRWQPVSPAMKAGLTDHLWSLAQLLMLVPIPTISI